MLSNEPLAFFPGIYLSEKQILTDCNETLMTGKSPAVPPSAQYLGTTSRL